MKVPFVDLDRMHAPLHVRMMQAIDKVLTKGNFILGDEVQTFEESFASYVGAKYAVGVSSGLAALELALKAYDIGEGDEVIVPANTFIATAAAVSFVNATPVLVEPAARSYNIDPQAIEAAITPRTKAIIPVHLYGIPARMDEIMEIARRHNLFVIEDASQAHGAAYKGQRVGSIGHAAAFSLYPAKNLGAVGDAGIITTNDETIVSKLHALRNCGQLNKYEHIVAPHNYRLDTIHAAVLEIKLHELSKWNEDRQQAAQWYNDLLRATFVIRPEIPENSEAVWHLYVIRTAERDALKTYLAERNVSTAVHYPIPIHKTGFYATAPIIAGSLPTTESQAGEILSLPIFPGIRKDEVEYVVNCIRKFEEEYMIQGSLYDPMAANR
jgi:dTDP-4-amino-4,6-dideoxygalactose transaminase